jgi:hypothetical protein
MTHPRAKSALARVACSLLVALVAACASDQGAEGHEPPAPGTGATDPDSTPAEHAPADGAGASDRDDQHEPIVPEIVELIPGVVDESVSARTDPRPLDEGTRDPQNPYKPAFMFDRVIVKVKPGTLVDKWAVRTHAERATGEKVMEVKVGQRGRYLVVFRPLDAARDRNAQEALVRALQATGTFEYVEPDAIMTAR